MERPTIGEVRKRMRGSLLPAMTQKVKQPLIESGVKLEPALQGGNRIGRMIGRVWSALWAYDKSVLQLLRCSANGFLYVHSPDLAESTQYKQNGNFNGANWVPFDLGAVVDYVDIIGIDAIVWAEFSMDNSTWSHEQFALVLQAFGGQYMTRLQTWTRCRYVRVKDYMAAGNDVVNVNGFVW